MAIATQGMTSEIGLPSSFRAHTGDTAAKVISSSRDNAYDIEWSEDLREIVSNLWFVLLKPSVSLGW